MTCIYSVMVLLMAGIEQQAFTNNTISGALDWTQTLTISDVAGVTVTPMAMCGFPSLLPAGDGEEIT